MVLKQDELIPNMASIALTDVPSNLHPYPSLAVTRDLTSFTKAVSKRVIFKPLHEYGVCDTNGTNPNVNDFCGKATTKSDLFYKGGTRKYGQKGRASAKRGRACLTNAEKPNSADFWKIRMFSPVDKNINAVAKLRPKSHVIQPNAANIHKSNLKNRPKTCHPLVDSGIQQVGRSSKKSVRIEEKYIKSPSPRTYYELDPDTVNPNHLLDVLQSENVAIPKSGCYSVLSNVSSKHTSSPILKPKKVEMVIVNSRVSSVQSQSCPYCINSKDCQAVDNPLSQDDKSFLSKMDTNNYSNISLDVSNASLTKGTNCVKAVQHHLNQKKSYSNILDTLRDKYAYNVTYSENSNDKKHRKSITISNIGVAQSLSATPEGNKSPDNLRIKDELIFPAIKTSPKNIDQQDETFKSCDTSTENSCPVPGMSVEIRASRYFAQNKGCAHLNGVKTKKNKNTYDVQRERLYNRKFIRKRLGGDYSLQKTRAPCNTPQLSNADPSVAC